MESFTRFPLAIGGMTWLALLISLTTSAGGSSARAGLFIVWATVIAEYTCRLVLAPHSSTYLRRRWLEPVAIVFPPLLITHVVGIDKAVVAIETALIRARTVLLHHSLVRVLLASGVVLVMGAWVVDLSERHMVTSNIHSFGTALWWAVVTVTTVGYGEDILPLGWKLLTTIIALSGMFAFAWTTSVLLNMMKMYQEARVARRTSKEKIR